MTVSQPHSLDFPLCCESLSHTARREASLKSSPTPSGYVSTPASCERSHTRAALHSVGSGALAPLPSWHFCRTALRYRGYAWKGATIWKREVCPVALRCALWNSRTQGVLSSPLRPSVMRISRVLPAERAGSFLLQVQLSESIFPLQHPPHVHRLRYTHWHLGLHGHGTIKTFKYKTANLSYLEHETNQSKETTRKTPKKCDTMHKAFLYSRSPLPPFHDQISDLPAR